MTGLGALPFLTAGVVVVGWIAFWIVMATRPKPPATPRGDAASPTPPERERRDRRSILGIVAQGLAYAVVWSPPHWEFLHRALERDGHRWGPLSVMLLMLVTGATLAGVLIASSAVRTLGRQWSLVARVTATHELVTAGPYARVRHPIYTGMLAMLVATALALSGPWPFVIALVCFGAGTAQRVRIEEQLLRAMFGAAFDDYASRVPAVLPRAQPRSRS
jgi:protein-S-isoprenylcysteine O-methyltransferase Ste14